MASGCLLDTNILGAAMGGEPRALLNRLAGLAAVRDLTAGMPPLPFDADAAMTCARIRAALERKGQMIGQLDCLIAAQAVARELVLVTDDLREFRRVPGLRCENWMR